jgi:hypothetical protein
LLLLQLLVALLGVFALARPALTSQVPVNRTIVLAMDVSAPMLANDGDPATARQLGLNPPAGGYTRLDEARAAATAVLGEMRAGDRVVVLRMADRAEVAAIGTWPADRGAIQTAIDRLQAQPAELDLGQGLEVAGGLTQTARLGLILIVTGGVVDVERVSHRPPVAVRVIPVGRGDADNQAITALAARRAPAGDLEVFARVQNYGDQPVSGVLRVGVDGELYQEMQVDLDPRRNREFRLTEFPPTTAVVEASFARANPDLLSVDNVATAAVAVPPLRKVLLVGGRSDQLERALRAVPGVELTKIDPQRYDPRGGYDLYVFEAWYPPAPPPGHWLLIDPPARGSPITVQGTLGRRTDAGRETNDAQIVRVLPSPLLQGVDLTGVGVTEAKKVVLPAWAEEVVAARESPLVFMGYPRPYRAVVFAFDLRSSNLFGRIGFPILASNTVNWLTGEIGVGGSGAGESSADSRFLPGDALLLQPLPRTTSVQIDTPSKRTYRFEGNQPVRFVDTARPGAYTVTQFAGTQEIARRVHVASVLQQGRESALADLKPRENLPNLTTLGGPQPGQVVLGPGREQSHIEWWRVLGVLALAGLMAEWWWFHR